MPLGLLPAVVASAALLNTCRVIDIAIDTDVEFAARGFGGDAFEARRYLVDLVTKASVITTASLDVRVRIASLQLREGPTRFDPWDAPNADEQVAQFVAWRTRQQPSSSADLAILFSGRDLGGCAAETASVCTDKGCAVLSNLSGRVPIHPRSFEEDNRDLILTLRAIGAACGAPRTTECEGKPSDATEGSIMSRCDERAGGFAHVSLAFADESVAAIWTYLDHVPCRLGGAESGVVAASDLLYVVAGTHAVVPILANDDQTNCGPVIFDGADARTAEGVPLSVLPDANGVERLIISLPRDSLGTDSVTYGIQDAEGSKARGKVEIVVRRADFNGDGRTDREDLDSLLDAWGAATLDHDLDGDGTVGSTDLALLLETWGGA